MRMALAEYVVIFCEDVLYVNKELATWIYKKIYRG